MAKVLLVGYIRELTVQRRNALVAGGFDVEIATTADDAARVIASSAFDAAVLGFSVPEAERNRFAQALLSANPAIKIIMLYFSDIKNTELAHALLPTTASVADIYRAVTHVLKPDDKSEID